MLLDYTLKEFDTAKREMDTAVAGEREKVSSFSTFAGPTPESVNAAAANQQPKTFAEYTARGGLYGSVQNAMQKVSEKRAQRNISNKFKQFLAAGESGADKLYADAVNYVGPESNLYIPPRGTREWGTDKEKVSFYDENGTFMPRQYAQAVAVGVRKWELDQKAKTERQQAGTIISGAQNPTEAYGQILQSGQSTEQYDKPVGTITTEEQRLKSEQETAKAKLDAEKAGIENKYLPAVRLSEIEKNNRTGTGGGKDDDSLKRERLDRYRNLLREYMKDRANLLLQDSDITKVRDPKKKLEISKSLDNYDTAIAQVEKNIKDLESGLGFTDTSNIEPEDSVKEKATFASEQIRSGLKNQPPKGTAFSESEVGSGQLRKDRPFWPDSKPSTDAYNYELANRVKKWADENGMPWANIETITTTLKNKSLEETMEYILKANKARGSNPGTPK